MDRLITFIYGENCRIVCGQIITECLAPLCAGDYLCKLSDGEMRFPPSINHLIDFLETSTGYPIYILAPAGLVALAGSRLCINLFKKHFETIGNAFEKTVKNIMKEKFGEHGDYVYEILSPIIQEHINNVLTNLSSNFVSSIPTKTLNILKQSLKSELGEVIKAIVDEQEEKIKELIKEKEITDPKPDKNVNNPNPINQKRIDFKTVVEAYYAKHLETKKLKPLS